MERMRWARLLAQIGVSAVVLGAWWYVQSSIIQNAVPEGNRDIVMRGMGILDSAVILVLTFWIGTSLSSQVKDERNAGRAS